MYYITIKYSLTKSVRYSLNDERKRNRRNCVIRASEAASQKLNLVLYVKQVIIFGRKKKHKTLYQEMKA